MAEEYQVVDSAESSVPHNAESEAATIGSVLIDASMYYQIARVLKAEDFYIHRNKYIWEAFGRLAAKAQAIDLVTVSDELSNAGLLAEIGGSSYITALINSVASSYNAVSYAYIVREHSERRKGISIANAMAKNSYNLEKPFELAQQAGLIFAQSKGIGTRVDAKDAAGQMIDLMDKNDFCTTSIPDVDKKIGGYFGGELSMLAGYAGTGKSALKSQAARRNAENGKRVLLCDLEMTAAQTWFRMACGDLGVDMNQVRSGRITDEKRAKIVEYAAELGEKYQGKIVIYEAPMTPGDILSAVMMEQPDIVFVDVLKNISGKGSRDNIRDWYDYVVNFLRVNIALSKDCGRPHVQVLHHLSRGAKKENRKPTKEDLMFAGESDSDGIHILWRKGENEGTEVVPVTWITDKSRFGWTGEEDINFNLPKQSFFGMEKQRKY
jgi:replicative DNA helicase